MFHPAYGGWDLHAATIVAWSLSEKKLRSTRVCSDFFVSPPFEHVEIFEPWNAQVLKQIALIYLRLDMAKQLKEIELPCFNEVLVTRSITIIDQAYDWHLPHLQNKTHLCTWLSGLTISLCECYTPPQPAWSALKCAWEHLLWLSWQVLVSLFWNTYSDVTRSQQFGAQQRHIWHQFLFWR